MIKRVYKAPENFIKPDDHFSVFLAGSIEMGKAEDWQTKLTDKIINNYNLEKLIVVNPRRDDWNNEWKQDKSDSKFYEQVQWELNHIEASDFCVVYFDKDTKSPITLLELGIMSQMKPSNVIVYCPKGFYRYGNVDIVCYRYCIDMANDLDDIVHWLEKQIYEI